MEIVKVILVVFLVAVLLFVVTRWFWNWYFKINARLHEQKKTNELLQNIYNVLVANPVPNKTEAPTVVAEIVPEQ